MIRIFFAARCKFLEIIFTLTIILYFAFVGIAQQVLVSVENTDSLKRDLQLTNDKVRKADLYALLGGAYRRINIDTSFYYGNLALKLATELDNPRLLVHANSVLMAPYVNIGNYSKAMEVGHKALAIAREHDLEEYTGWALNHFGLIYTNLKNYEKALWYYKAQEKANLNINNKPGMAYFYQDYGNVLIKLNQLDSAEYYTRKAESTFEFISLVEPYVYRNFGEIEERKGNYKKTIKYFRQGLELSEKHNIHRTTADFCNLLAQLFYKQNQIDSAILYAEKSLKVSFDLKKLLTILAKIFEGKDQNLSYKYLKLSKETGDEMYGSDKITALLNEIAVDREKQIEEEQQKIQTLNTIKQGILLAGVVFLSIIGIFLYRNNLQRKKANAKLYEQKQKLENTLSQLKSTQSQLIQSEKMASLGELTAGIAHEIQNPLNFVNNFSEVSNELIEEVLEERKKDQGARNEEIEDEILTDIKENLTKINHHGKRASDIVKGMLEHSRKSSGEKEPTDINALCDEYLRLGYQGQKAKDKDFNSTMETHFDPNLPKIDIIPQDIGRVILNLINNAFYAVNERSKNGENGYQPTVSVSSGRVDSPRHGVAGSSGVGGERGKGEIIQIIIKDNGYGILDHIKDKIFQPFFTTKPTGQGTGLGLSLSYDIVKAHGGEMKVDTKEGEGSKFIILLPV